MKTLKKHPALFALIFAFFCAFVRAEMVDTYQFKNDQDRTRAVELAKSLRCPQCQNQNLVESNSPIAYDLRIEVYKMVDEGASNQQIIDQMTARFGNFVNYKPPFQWNTALLWLAPLGLFLGALGLIWRNRRVRLPTHRAEATQGENDAQTSKYDISILPTKTTLIRTFALLLFPILAASIFYFSLDRFNQVKMGEAAQLAAQNAQVETPHSQKNNDVIGQIQDKLRADPNNADAWLALGEAYVQNDEFQHALIAYANAQKLNGAQPEILGLQATAQYYLDGQQITPSVRKLLDRALAENKNEVSSLNLLAADSLQRKDYAQARAYWQQLLDSNNPAVNRRMVIQRMKMVDYFEGK